MKGIYDNTLRYGGEVVAAIGCQMILNHSRGHSNRPIFLTI